MSRSTFPLLGLVVLVPTAGSAPKLNDPPKAASYFPAEVGNKWTYKHSAGFEFTEEVTAVEVAGSQTLVTIELQGRPRVFVVTWDGVFERHLPGFLALPPARRLRLPLQAGDSWLCGALPWPGVTATSGTMTVGTEERVMVPAGTFAAVPVEWAITTRDGSPLPTPKVQTLWYARGVGLVRMKSSTNEVRLSSFTPGPAAPAKK